MSDIGEVLLTTMLVLAAAIWIGGYITVIVVARVSAAVLEGEARVRFFRRFGATFYAVATPALLVAYATGGFLLSRLPWTGTMTALAVEALALLLVLVAGVVQARDLTSLRGRLAGEPDDTQLAGRIRRRGRAAGTLRGVLGLLTLAMIVQVAVLLA